MDRSWNGLIALTLIARFVTAGAAEHSTAAPGGTETDMDVLLVTGKRSGPAPEICNRIRTPTASELAATTQV